MRKSIAFSSLALAATLALTACGGAAGSSPTAPSAEPVKAETPAATQDASKSSRGNIVKEFGQGASVTDLVNKKEVVNFTINSIAPGTCTEQYAQAPVNGNIVIVDVTAETKPELAEAIMTSFTLSGYDFKFIADNGTTFNGNLSTVGTYSCIPNAEVFPSAGMGPGEKITAKVVLDVPQPHGILVLKAPGSNTTGWEYKF